MPLVAQSGTVTLEALYRNSANQSSDATAVQMQLRDPSGTVVYGPLSVPPILHDGLGRYHYTWDVLPTEALGTWTAEWSGIIAGQVATGNDFVEVVLAGSIVVGSSLVSIDTVQALMSPSLSDADLQALIDQEEAWLARRIGPLTGARTERFVSVRSTQDIRLQRPTAVDNIFAVDDHGTDATSTVELRRYGWRVSRTGATAWLAANVLDAKVAITYQPTDELEVRRVLLTTLIPLALSQAGAPSMGYEQEVIGTYSYTIGTGAKSPQGLRYAAVRSLLEPREPETNRIHSRSAPEPWGFIP